MITTDPVDLALQEIAETKQLAEMLIQLSGLAENQRAAAILEELRLKCKVLGRVAADLKTRRGEELIDIPFPGASDAADLIV